MQAFIFSSLSLTLQHVPLTLTYLKLSALVFSSLIHQQRICSLFINTHRSTSYIHRRNNYYSLKMNFFRNSTSTKQPKRSSEFPSKWPQLHLPRCGQPPRQTWPPPLKIPASEDTELQTRLEDLPQEHHDKIKDFTFKAFIDSGPNELECNVNKEERAQHRSRIAILHLDRSTRKGYIQAFYQRYIYTTIPARPSHRGRGFARGWSRCLASIGHLSAQWYLTTEVCPLGGDIASISQAG